MRARLKELSDAYEGDREDGKAIFEGVIVPLAQEAGLPFTYEEGIEFASEPRSLGDGELESVAGGGTCILIGGTSDGENVGSCTSLEFGGTACYYVGVGLFHY